MNPMIHGIKRVQTAELCLLLLLLLGRFRRVRLCATP